LLFPLILLADAELYQFLLHSGVEPYFALSWVLTWFSHGFDDLNAIARLFDLFIAAHPLMPLYLGAQIILHFRTELFSSVECEYSAVHRFLVHIPQDLPFEDIIKRSVSLFNRFPPGKLLKHTRVTLSPNSPIRRYPFEWMWKVQHPSSLRVSKQQQQQQQQQRQLSLDNSRNHFSLGESLLFLIVFGGLVVLCCAVFFSVYRGDL